MGPGKHFVLTGKLMEVGVAVAWCGDDMGRSRGVWQHWTPERQFSEAKQKCLTSVLG